ncbi:hypothetical protein D3C85_1461290 [compost metagenome]
MQLDGGNGWYFVHRHNLKTFTRRVKCPYMKRIAMRTLFALHLPIHFIENGTILIKCQRTGNDFIITVVIHIGCGQIVEA